MKDSLGNELSVGDKVAFVSCNRQNVFRCIDTGIIEKITEYKVLIGNTKNEYYFNYNRKYDGHWIREHKTYRNPNRVIKIEF